eukprot:7256523-Ditylum_brightwellii.AAC.1
MKKSSKHSDVWFDSPLIILDKEVVNYFVDYKGNMTTDVKSHVDDAGSQSISFLRTKESMTVTQKFAAFSGNGAVHSSMDVDDVTNAKEEINKIRYDMEEMSRYLEASQNMEIDRLANMLHMMQ